MIMKSEYRAGPNYWTNQSVDRLMKDLMNRPVEDLVLGESKFHGARFYTVEPVGGNWMDMEVWCLKVFGPSAEVWDIKATGEQFIWPELGRWYKNDRRFWFRNEQDRTLFILKWSV
jgi:hypothetical protein